MKTLFAFIALLAISLSTPACKTTNPDGTPNTIGKIVNCSVQTVVQRAPDIYMTVSNVLTSADSYEQKRQRLIELGGKVGHEVVVCATRQYIADVEEDGRMGAKDPATAKGAEDGRKFIEETGATFDDPAPTAGAMKRPPSN